MFKLFVILNICVMMFVFASFFSFRSSAFGSIMNDFFIVFFLCVVCLCSVVVSVIGDGVLFEDFDVFDFFVCNVSLGVKMMKDFFNVVFLDSVGMLMNLSVCVYVVYWKCMGVGFDGCDDGCGCVGCRGDCEGDDGCDVIVLFC